MDTTGLFTHSNDIIYFNNASSAPLPVPTRERMKQLIDDLSHGDLPWDFWVEQLSRFRVQAGNLLGSETSEIGFIPNTSTGLLIALYTIQWGKDDNIVFMEDGFPANKVPWVRNLRAIDKRMLSYQCEGCLEDRIMESIDDNTKAVVIDWVDFFTGYKVDLKAIGDACKEKGAFLVVDAMQGLGAQELDISRLDVDFLAAGSAKWLLGPVGAGILYINKGTMERLETAFQGWMAHDWKEFNIYDPLPPLKEGAGRFEVGSYPGIILVGLIENLNILNSIGLYEIHRTVMGLRRLLVKALKERGGEFISPLDERHASGLLTFRPKGGDSSGLFDHLNRNMVITSLRKEAIRLSPHFYNTEKEVNTFLEIIDDF